MRFEAILGRSVNTFWATSYAFDLPLFDEYLLRRLAPSGLNAVVLVDHSRLASLWDRVATSQSHLIRQPGHRYLLRGVRLTGGGSFHPKSYLLGQRDTATLVVGSGNLTRGGIDYGFEVFNAFSSDREEDLPTMRGWARWLGRIVDAQADELLTERWAALRGRCAWMLGPDEGSRLLTNETRPLADQLRTHLPDVVQELHITAPFFDRHADAVRRLLDTAAPRSTVVYLGAEAKVDGQALRGVLSGRPNVSVRRFQPSTFVHAKLIGAIGADGNGVLLGGSANLSIAALYKAAADAGGNCELAVLHHGGASQIRAAFAARLPGSSWNLTAIPPGW